MWRDYADHALRKASVCAGGQCDGVAWLREKDLYTRGLMVNYMRGGMSQGLALTTALKESEVTWTSGRIQGSSKRSRSPSDEGDANVENTSSGKRKRAGKAKSKADKLSKYVITAPGGQKFCQAWNRGGCSKDEKACRNKEIHACNIHIGNGKACWKRRHRAVNHE